MQGFAGQEQYLKSGFFIVIKCSRASDQITSTLFVSSWATSSARIVSKQNVPFIF